MADDRAYRVVLTFDPERERFLARVPELCVEVEAPTRAEALVSAEHDVEARINEAAQTGTSLPSPTAPMGAVDPLTLRLTPTLAQDLAHLAGRHGLTVEGLAVQLLAQGVGRLEGVAATTPPRDRESGGQKTEDVSVDQRPPLRRKRREGYHSDLEDKANFMDYVRNLERGGGRGRR